MALAQHFVGNRVVEVQRLQDLVQQRTQAGPVRHGADRRFGRDPFRLQSLGIEEVFLLCAIGPAQHQEVLHTLRLFGEQVIPHFQAKT